jgi:sugar transferase EpsL
MKRLVDLILASVAVLVCAPLMLVAALLVRRALGAPVLFGQPRLGLRGRPFRILKFRTMTDERMADGTLAPDERRLTTLGRVLRSTSLDELPELFNVLRGDMSLVGPRPLVVRYGERYSAEQARRHDVRPGITGWAQVNGRNTTSWDERFRLDVWYVDHRSLALDARILALTLWKVLRREGISHPGHVTMEEFKPHGSLQLRASHREQP